MWRPGSEDPYGTSGIFLSFFSLATINPPKLLLNFLMSLLFMWNILNVCFIISLATRAYLATSEDSSLKSLRKLLNASSLLTSVIFGNASSTLAETSLSSCSIYFPSSISKLFLVLTLYSISLFLFAFTSWFWSVRKAEPEDDKLGWERLVEVQWLS